MKLERILLTTDFSDCARRAYRTAAEIARLDGGKIDLVYSLTLPWPNGLVEEEVRPLDYETLRQAVHDKLDDETLHPDLLGVRMARHVLEESGPESVCRHALATGADMIIQSSHGHTGFHHLVLGSFAEQVVRRAEVPVLTVKLDPEADAPSEPEIHFPPRTILFPHDLSPLSLQALDALRLVARRSHSKIHVFHAWHDIEFVTEAMLRAPANVQKEFRSLQDSLPSRVQRQIEEFAESELEGIAYTCESKEGEPTRAILDAARRQDADWIVMSTHGHTGWRRWWLGSIAEKVLRLATCPVLTVRLPEREVHARKLLAESQAS